MEAWSTWVVNSSEWPNNFIYMYDVKASSFYIFTNRLQLSVHVLKYIFLMSKENKS